jgi:hypothetical protein
MRISLTTLAIAALVGFAGQANAQAQCPELSRLRSEASKPVRGVVPAPERCAAYTRVAMAWNEITQYANGHREACDISASSLNDFENYRREAVKARDNVCAGRPARPFPPEVIQR